MKIEAGRYYRTRDGKKKAYAVGVIPQDKLAVYLEDELWIYSADGRFNIPPSPSEPTDDDEWDLVAEWQEPVSAEVFMYLLKYDGENPRIRTSESKYEKWEGDVLGVGHIRITEGGKIEVLE